MPLFNPRRHKWSRHFRRTGPVLTGLTARGRATIRVLKINLEHRVEFRRELIEEGSFPPQWRVALGGYRERAPRALGHRIHHESTKRRKHQERGRRSSSSETPMKSDSNDAIGWLSRCRRKSANPPGAPPRWICPWGQIPRTKDDLMTSNQRHSRPAGFASPVPGAGMTPTSQQLQKWLTAKEASTSNSKRRKPTFIKKPHDHGLRFGHQPLSAP